MTSNNKISSADDDKNILALDILGNVAVIKLNRPERINAINNELRMRIPQMLGELDNDPEIHAVVLHGGEAKGFCAGADITEKRGPQSAVEVRQLNMRHAWIDAFEAFSKPIIAAVHGFCFGGGLEIALACDIRIASSDAKFSLPETGLGLIPGAGGTQRLHRIIGFGRAMDLLLTGERIDAAEAQKIGLITRLVEDQSDLLEKATDLATRIAERAPLATLYAKEALKSGSDLALGDGLTLERGLFALLTSTSDSKEAANAFREKRAPKFSGK